mgnify:FL=1
MSQCLLSDFCCVPVVHGGGSFEQVTRPGGYVDMSCMQAEYFLCAAYILAFR